MMEWLLVLMLSGPHSIPSTTTIGVFKSENLCEVAAKKLAEAADPATPATITTVCLQSRD